MSLAVTSASAAASTALPLLHPDTPNTGNAPLCSANTSL